MWTGWNITAVTDPWFDNRLVALGFGEREYFVAHSCYGVCIGLRSNSPALLAALMRLAPGSRCDDIPEVVFSIYNSRERNTAGCYAVAVNGKIAPARLRLTEALQLLQCYMQEIVAMRAYNLVLVHAAVAGWKGVGLLLPGASGSGKSTLAMALVEQGATYYSDELAVLDESGRVHPYLRPPHLRSLAGRDTAKRLKASILAGDICPKPVPVACVVLSQYSRTATLERRLLLSRDTFFGLLRNTVAVRSRPELSLKVLKEVSLRARGVELERGEAREAASAVLEMMPEESS